MNVRGVPARLLIFGDAAAAAKYLPVAQSLAEGLWDNEGKRTFAKRRILVGGAKITAEVNRPARFVRLTVEVLGCPKFTSGFLDFWFDAQGNPVWTVPRSGGGTEDVLNRFYPRTANQGGSIYGPWGYSRQLATNLTRDEDGSAYANSVMYKVPGKYTGEMRKVVQALIGQGEAIYYGYRFDLCHGIYKAGDGTPWVIEISKTGGVVAWKLPVCGQHKAGSLSGTEKELVDKLGYWPVKDTAYRTKRDEAIAKGKARVLANPVVLNDFYQHWPFFTACGWAFSPTGHEAQNTCWDWDDDSGRRYMRGYRYRITIAEVDNQPVRATLSLVEQDIIYGDKISGFKVPFEELNTLVNHDYHTWATPPATSFAGPLYVFYDLQGQVVVARVLSAEAAVSYNDSPYNVASPWNPDITGTVYNIAGTSSKPNVPVIDGKMIQGSDVSGTITRLDYTTTTQGAGFGVIPALPYAYAVDQAATSHVTVVEPAGGTQTMTNGQSLIVPFNDREAIYGFTSIQEDYGHVFVRDKGTHPFLRGQQVAKIYFGGLFPHCSGAPAQPWLLSGEIFEPYSGAFLATWGDTGGSFAQWHSGNPSVGYFCANTWEDWSTYTAETFVEETGYILYTNTLKLVTSLGDYDLPPPATAQNMISFWDGSNSHFMTVIRDNYSTAIVASKEVDGTDGPNLYSTADRYPINQLDASKKTRLFVGIP